MDRRDWLCATAAWLALGEALAQGKLQPGVRRVRGEASINGAPAQEGMTVRPGDDVVTAANGEIVWVIGRDAMLARAGARLQVARGATAGVAGGLRILTGAVLSVFVPGQRKTISTPTATIGVRGTAVYVEAQPERAYACACYGVADFEPLGEPASRETVRTRHHDHPRYILPRGAPRMIMGAPVVNHTDAELTMLEALVGRKPPFA